MKKSSGIERRGELYVYDIDMNNSALQTNLTNDIKTYYSNIALVCIHLLGLTCNVNYQASRKKYLILFFYLKQLRTYSSKVVLT